MGLLWHFICCHPPSETLKTVKRQSSAASVPSSWLTFNDYLSTLHAGLASSSCWFFHSINTPCPPPISLLSNPLPYIDFQCYALPPSANSDLCLIPRAFKCPPLCPKWLSKTSSIWRVSVWAKKIIIIVGTVPQRKNLIDSFIWFQTHSSSEEIAYRDRSWKEHCLP